MVKEGIDMKPVIVRANSGGYTTYDNNSHQYLIRVFAKAKGGNLVVEAQLTGLSAPVLEVHGEPIHFHQKNHESGWGVYKKSLAPTIKFSQTRWTTAPKKLCADNLAKQMGQGKSKASVLAREWKLTANALFSFRVAVTSKGHANKGNYSPNNTDEGAAALLYPVSVVCRAAG